MSINPQAGQTQLNNISVSTGNSVTQGDTIGYLKVANVSSHLQFALWQFGQSKFQVFGVSGIPLCPEAQFTPQAKDSILNLLHVTWPNAGMCYQD
jgi:murein DD-endopeptidase MepM/ murein hydrolase activator NlpD